MAEGLDEYEVGYGKTPVHTRFKPGHSGNRKGRPKGARGLKAEFEAELNEFATITVDGKAVRIRKTRLVIKALVAKAAKGNVSAADKVLALMMQMFGHEEERPVVKVLSETDRLILEQFMSDERGVDDDFAGPNGDGPAGEIL